MTPRGVAAESRTGGRLAGFPSCFPELGGRGGEERRGSAFRLGRIHPRDELIELGSKVFQRSATALLQFLVLLGGEDNKFSTIMAGDGERFSGGEAGDVAELVFEHARGDLGQRVD